MSNLLEELTVILTTTWYRDWQCIKARQKFDMKRLGPKKLNNVDVKSSSFGKLDSNVDISRTWERIRENIKISARQTSRKSGT
jgi:hypothetical protein